MKSFLTLVSVLVFSFGASAAEITASHRAAIEKLLAVSQVQKQIEASVGPALEGGLGISEDQIKALPQAQQDKMKGAIAKVKAFMLETLAWEKLKDEVTATYAKHFTEQEAVTVTQMLESDAGKLLLSKQLAMTTEMVKVTQDRMKAALPQVMQIMQTEMQK